MNEMAGVPQAAKSACTGRSSTCHPAGLSVLRVLTPERRGGGLTGAGPPGLEECLKQRVSVYLGNGTSWY